MNFIVSIDSRFTNYNFIEDVLDFHTNGDKKSILCYIDFHPLLMTYATKRCMELKKVQLDDITKGYYAIILGENNLLLNKCKELKLKRGLIKKEI